MSSFTKAPRLEAIPPTYRLYKVVKSFEYHVGTESSPEVITIKKDFITDGASIPKICWSIIGGPLGPYAPAAVVHDYCYKFKLYSRKRCDEIFLEAMTILKVGWLKRRIMYRAVRIFAGRGWRKHRGREKKDVSV